MKLSTNLTLKEATKSRTAIRKGISNEPTKEEIEKLKLTAEKVFQPVRSHFNLPIGITSMFRTKELNIKIGGSETSQHCKAEAIDMDADMFGGVCLDNEGNEIPFTNKMIFDYIRENLDFDQLIWEFGTSDEPAWIHVSYKKEGNRNRALKAFRNTLGKTQYLIL